MAKLVKEKGGEFSENEVDWKTILNQDTDIKLPRSAWVGKLMRLLLKPMFSIYFSLKKEGQDKIPLEPAIYVGNHQSFLDALIFNQAISSAKMEKYILSWNNSAFRFTFEKISS